MNVGRTLRILALGLLACRETPQGQSQRQLQQNKSYISFRAEPAGTLVYYHFYSVREGFFPGIDGPLHLMRLDSQPMQRRRTIENGIIRDRFVADRSMPTGVVCRREISGLNGQIDEISAERFYTKAEIGGSRTPLPWSPNETIRDGLTFRHGDGITVRIVKVRLPYDFDWSDVIFRADPEMHYQSRRPTEHQYPGLCPLTTSEIRSLIRNSPGFVNLAEGTKRGDSLPPLRVGDAIQFTLELVTTNRPVGRQGKNGRFE